MSVSDNTAPVAAVGFIGTLTLAEVNVLVSILVGVATLGYVVTKWVMLVRRNRRPPPALD